MLSRYRGALAIALLLALAAATPVHAQPVGEKLVIDTPDPQFELSATVGIAWLEQFDVRGGGPDPARRDDLSWEAKDIPPWLSLSPRFGVLTGTPTQAGRFTFKIAAEDLSPGTGWIKSDETEYSTAAPTMPSGNRRRAIAFLSITTAASTRRQAVS